MRTPSPSGSTSTLSNREVAEPSFFIDLAGTYRFELRRWPEETAGTIRGVLPEGGEQLDIVKASLQAQDFNQTIALDDLSEMKG